MSENRLKGDESVLYGRWSSAVREAKELQREYERRAAAVGEMERWRDDAHAKYSAKVQEQLTARRALEAHVTGENAGRYSDPTDDGIE